jgi:4'-phosphopantetheinyl transferase
VTAIFVSRVEPQILGEPGLADRYIELLDESERRRYARYVFDEHRLEYLAGCVMAKRRIAELSRVQPGEVRFRRDCWGRPHVAEPDRCLRYHFSISHTKGYVVCAVSESSNIGVDVERTDRAPAHLPVSESCFASTELSDLGVRDGADLSGRFVQYWTLKEAYAKAVGKGLSLPFNGVVFSISDTADPQVTFDGVDDDSRSWVFKVFQVGQRHVMSLAFPSSPRVPLKFSRWHPAADVFVDEPLPDRRLREVMG